MRILPNNIAILDEPDQLCAWVEESGKLCHDGSVAEHYLTHIKAGDVAIDAGAAIGDHTIAYLSKTGIVHAFECDPKMLECLRHNCPMASIYPFALHDRHGSLFQHAGSEGGAGGNYLSISAVSETSLPCVRLDDFRFPKVDFIKWDIEGSEVSAIKGAKNTIQRCKPVMIVEVHDGHLKRAGYSMEFLENLIKSLGYSITVMLGDRSERRYEALCLPNQG